MSELEAGTVVLARKPDCVEIAPGRYEVTYTFRVLSPVVAAFKAHLDSLPTDDDRIECLRELGFCMDCGRPDGRTCQCWNDE